jgi:hypothetical protein
MLKIDKEHILIGGHGGILLLVNVRNSQILSEAHLNAPASICSLSKIGPLYPN